MSHPKDPLRERLRGAAVWDDDADWRDVRRRARRRRAPAILASALVAVIVAAPAVAFRHQIADLVASPESNQYVWMSADCGRGPFALEFDPARGATVSQGGQALATASLSDRQIRCNAPIQKHKTTPDASPYHGDLDGSRYGATTLTCATNAPLEIVVNPSWEGSEITGSTLLVAERETKRSIASAVFQRDPHDGHNWSRTYWNRRVCSSSEPAG